MRHELAWQPPVLHVSVRTIEANGRHRDQCLTLHVVEWQCGRAVVLDRIGDMLDAAAAAAEKAQRDARLAGPAGVLP